MLAVFHFFCSFIGLAELKHPPTTPQEAGSPQEPLL